MVDTRLVVLWKPSENMVTLLREQLPHWRFLCAETTQEFEALSRKIGYFVALFFIEETPAPATLSELENLFRQYSQTQWVGMVAPSQMDNTELCKLIFYYAYDFHSLPLSAAKLTDTLGHALGMASLWQKIDCEVEASIALPDIVGISQAMDKVRELVCTFAKTRAPVLITGESGTGKDVVARALHKLSARADGPYVPVNCGAFPEGLIQSELFGHKRGAFTGAIGDKQGKVESAQGGTLFLDEIGDLPKALQVHLLRFLQEGTIEKVGVSTPIPVDVRIIAATHVDLNEAVSMSAFRQDLFYRLNVLHIHIPALRERPEDIPLLAEHFLRRYSLENSRRIVGLTSAAYDQLTLHTWPGNVRELINCMQRAILMSNKRTIGPNELGLPEARMDPLYSLSEARQEADRNAIEQSLRYTRNNVSAASRILDISRHSLYRLMEKYEFRHDDDTDLDLAATVSRLGKQP